MSRDFVTTWAQSKVFTLPLGTSAEHKFTCVAVDGGGSVYTCWADANNVYYSVSQDIKTSNTPTWSAPVRVDNGPNTKTCVLPMMAAGSAGRVIFGWYGTTADNSQTPGAPWSYFTARCNNGRASDTTGPSTLTSTLITSGRQMCIYARTERAFTCPGLAVSMPSSAVAKRLE